MTRADLEAQLNSYLALQADALDEGDIESAEALLEAAERVCDLLDALA